MARSVVRRRGGVAIVDVLGEVNADAAGVLDAAWADATATPVTAVILNFSATGYLNSTGIALIVGLLTRARAAGLPLRAYGLSPHYREVFEITRLADYIALRPDEDAAIGADEQRPAGVPATDSTTDGQPGQGDDHG